MRGSARAARGVDRAACGCFCLGNRARREASCSSPRSPARARCTLSCTSCPGTVAGRKALAALLAQAAARLCVAERVCLSCASLNSVDLQKRRAIGHADDRPFPAPPPHACAPRASASRAAPGSAVSSSRQRACAPCSCAQTSCIAKPSPRCERDPVPHAVPGFGHRLAFALDDLSDVDCPPPPPPVSRKDAGLFCHDGRRDPGSSLSVWGVTQDEIADPRAATETKIRSRTRQNRRVPIKATAAATTKPA